MEVEVVNRFPKPPPGKVLRIWARKWFKEGREMDLGNLPKRPASQTLGCRAHLRVDLNRRMAKDHERPCSTGEAFIHASMTRLMMRRLSRA